MTTNISSLPIRPADSKTVSAIDRAYLQFDLMFSLNPLTEAIAVAQEAVLGSLRSLDALPPDISAEQVREKWRQDSIFLAALLRLASERATVATAAANRLTLHMDDR